LWKRRAYRVVTSRQLLGENRRTHGDVHRGTESGYGENHISLAEFEQSAAQVFTYCAMNFRVMAKLRGPVCPVLKLHIHVTISPAIKLYSRKILLVR
jgi:hypothetical protein